MNLKTMTSQFCALWTKGTVSVEFPSQPKPARYSDTTPAEKAQKTRHWHWHSLPTLLRFVSEV